MKLNYLYLLISFVLVSCNSSPEFNADYFIGTWERESGYYRCCDTCFENYKTDCTAVIEPGLAIYEFREDGTYTITILSSNEQYDALWCYNEETRRLFGKKGAGDLYTAVLGLEVQMMEENSFSQEKRSGVFLDISTFTRQ